MFVEWLTDGDDARTGQQMKERLELRYPPPPTELHVVSSRDEFLSTLRSIRGTSQGGLILQIDAHGYVEAPDDQKDAGLLPSRYFDRSQAVSWGELSAVLGDLNHRCRMKLLLTIGACTGIGSILIENPDSVDDFLPPVPFLYIVSFDRDLDPLTLKQSLEAYYWSLLNGRTITAAVDDANRESPEAGITFESIFALQAEALEEYASTELTAERKRAKALEITDQLIKSSSRNALQTFSDARRVQSPPQLVENIERILSARFRLDEFPENDPILQPMLHKVVDRFARAMYEADPQLLL